MTTAVITTIGSSDALTPTAVNDNFKSLANVINGQIDTANLKAKMVHVPFSCGVGTVLGGTTHRTVIARPANVATGTETLTRLIASAVGTAAVAQMAITVRGCLSFVDAVAFVGTDLTNWAPKVLPSAVGLTAVEDTTAWAIGSYTHFAVDFTAAAGCDYRGTILSGEITYTLQET